MADPEVQAARRNGHVENAAADIAGNVDNQIDVDSDSSLDNKLLEECVVRAPRGIARPPSVVARLANVKPPYLLEIDSMKKFTFKWAPHNFCALCSYSFSRNTWTSSVVKEKSNLNSWD